jgi:thiol-disulfide isomerase/thioredoxin
MRAALDAPIRTTSAVIDQILATGYPAVIVFETPGCGPCQALRPLLDELAHEYEKRVLVVRVTDSSEGWLAARYHLSFVPTLLFCRDRREHARIKGNPGRAALRAHIEFLISREHRPDPAEGPRHTLVARFGAAARGDRPRRPHALLLAGPAASA